MKGVLPVADHLAIERRSFLKATALAAAGLTVELAAPAKAAQKKFTTPSEFKSRLRGPILSAPTPYTADFKVDYQGMRNMITRGLNAGVRVFALTAGNSQYYALSYEEIKELTRVMVETVDRRGLTIAATGPWWTGKAVDYARFAQSVGADAVQVLLAQNGDDDGQVEHFKSVAASIDLGIVIHGNPSLKLIERLTAIDSVVAMKEEFTYDFTLQVYRKLGDRLNIFAGGTKPRFLVYQPYGMQAYYSAFAPFAPQTAMQFWSAVEKNDLNEARRIVIRYDLPFFERWSHPFWRATLEYFGVAKRYLRPPEKSFTASQVQELKAFYDGLGLKPGRT
jgi:dihydrodipicolinate synthase/N-acetylneuraminate lyase